MELEVDTNGLLEESIFEIDGDIDDTAFENERCGICMDIIIDRGVLDCCQHWFCFACIDNWATITNLCPLCQNEFQLITCVPVYDTIGSGKAEDDSLSRDDDWSIQGKNNTLSFPSYYIDENAVICLDGDGCKIRSGPATTEEDSNLDTSIACDSCDLWYHAFCVGFDPEGTSENSWLCPRCVVDEVPQKLDGVSIQRPSDWCASETANHECSVEAAFSGKVSVSVADAGETAVVVSMVEGKQWTEEPCENFLSVLEINKDGRNETYFSNSGANSPKLEKLLNERINNQPNVDAQETLLALSLSRDTTFNIPCNSLAHSELKINCVDKAICEPNGSDGCKISPHLLSDKPSVKSEPSESESNVDLHLGLSVGSSLSVDQMDNDATENHVAGDAQQHKPSKESSLSVEKMVSDANEDAVGISGVKRKSMSSRDVLVTEYTEHEDGDTKAKMETEVPAKKARSDGISQITPLKCKVSNSVSEVAQKCSILPKVSKGDKLRDVSEKKSVTSDIMSIVQGTDHRPSDGGSRLDPVGKSSKERDNGAGLRVKKIMRRAAEDESSVLVEKLRKEIREAVRNKATKDFSKSNLFDPKLLSAFRAAIVEPKTEPEPVKSSNPSVVRVKKSMLQNGKIRDNLTKKIYGTTGGKRRRAWDRDWEIEFWKHRCMRTTKPEKVETLKSVLDLLRKSSEMEQDPKGEAANPILSRLYLADTSVFPRKDDIKPLSALTGIANHEQNREHDLKENVSKSSNDKCTVQTSRQTTRSSSQVRVPSFDNKSKKGNAQSLKGEAACRNVHPNGATPGPNSISLSGASKVNSQTMKELSGKSDDAKSDKRKWALEVLARKTSMVGMNATQGKQEDNAVLKGNYPLLTQLPTDMRPVLAPSRHNKVPISVRQAQLYRLTEHFLRKADLPVIRRTADTELAVADAVNIEKEVADKSNSKLVYVNLCSQMLSQHINESKPIRATESNPSESAVCTESTEPALKEYLSDPSVEEALRLAGLVSDSPPNSPYHQTKDLDDEDDPSIRAREEEGPDNVFDVDSHPELDIYGDFEYDLEDEDYIGASALVVSKSKPEEGDSKMKVVFSTLNSERVNNALDSNDHERLEIVEAPIGSLCLLECHNDRAMGSSTLDVRTETSCPPPDPLQGEIDGEPSLAECEELYGPDKDPLVERFSINASREPDKLTGKEASAENIAPGENGNCRSNKTARASEFESESCAENIFVGGRFLADRDSSGGENSPNHSLMSENVQRKETKASNNKQPDNSISISKKVEAYIKEHIRPLCKSGVITAEQYRWAVGKTTEKIMRYHLKDKNANFLIKEGEKVKKLAEQYVEAAQQKKEKQ